MPEGPEVCITAQYLLSRLKNKTITKISKKFSLNIVNYKIKHIDSKGKILWFELVNASKTIYLISQFGLTGEWSFEDDNNKLTIQFNDDINLYYNDVRGFGKINITNKKKELDTKLNKISVDLLKTDFIDDEFLETFNMYKNKSQRRKKMLIVKLLMDQHGIGSGIGNYLVCEILYHAKLSPFRTLDSLSNTEIKRLSHSIKYIMKLSYYNNSTGYMTHFSEFIHEHKIGIDNGKYPNYHPDIKLKKSQKFKFHVYRKQTDDKGNKVIADKIINNRSTYWIPEIQL